MSIFKRRGGGNHVDFGLFKQNTDAAGQFARDGQLAGLYFGPGQLPQQSLRLRFGPVFTKTGNIPYGVKAVRRVQQGFGRDATAVETHPSQQVFFKNGHFRAQMRGGQGGRIAGGTRSDDGNF